MLEILVRLFWLVPVAVTVPLLLVSIFRPRLIWTVPERVRELLGQQDSPAESGPLTDLARGVDPADMTSADRFIALSNLWALRCVAAFVLVSAVGLVLFAELR